MKDVLYVITSRGKCVYCEDLANCGPYCYRHWVMPDAQRLLLKPRESAQTAELEARVTTHLNEQCTALSEALFGQ